MDSKCSQIKTTLKNLLDLRTRFDEVYSRVDESKGRQDTENMQAIEFSESLMKEMQEAIKKFEKLIWVSLEEAQEIMNKGRKQNFMGPEQIKTAFGIELQPEQIPSIPFNEKELNRARKLGQFLVLRVNQVFSSNDPLKAEPLTMEKLNEMLSPKFEDEIKGEVLYRSSHTIHWYPDEDFYTKETPQAGWALVSKDVIPHSGNEPSVDEKRNYLVQTEKLIEYLKYQVFAGRKMPPIFSQAIKEFEEIRKREQLDRIIKDDWGKAAQILANLKITQLLRQSPVEILYDELIYFQNTGQRLLKQVFTWSRRLDSGGNLILVGYNDTDGIHVIKYKPDESGDYLGTCISRRV